MSVHMQQTHNGCYSPTRNNWHQSAGLTFLVTADVLLLGHGCWKFLNRFAHDCKLPLQVRERAACVEAHWGECVRWGNAELVKRWQSSPPLDWCRRGLWIRMGAVRTVGMCVRSSCVCTEWIMSCSRIRRISEIMMAIQQVYCIFKNVCFQSQNEINQLHTVKTNIWRVSV